MAVKHSCEEVVETTLPFLCMANHLQLLSPKIYILAEPRNKGSQSGISELLRRTVKRPPEWLCVNQQKDLYELAGGSPECKKGECLTARAHTVNIIITIYNLADTSYIR